MTLTGRRTGNQNTDALTSLPENDDIHGMEEIWEGINIFLNGLAE